MRKIIVAVFFLVISTLQLEVGESQNSTSLNFDPNVLKKYADEAINEIRMNKKNKGTDCIEDLIGSIETANSMLQKDLEKCYKYDKSDAKKKKCDLEMAERFRMRVDLWKARRDYCHSVDRVQS